MIKPHKNMCWEDLQALLAKQRLMHRSGPIACFFKKLSRGFHDKEFPHITAIVGKISVKERLHKTILA